MGSVTLLHGRRIYLDTNIFIYALSGFREFVPFLTDLFDAVEANACLAVTSELALAETLVIPFRHNDTDEERRCREIFRKGAGLELSPISIPVLEATARIRAATPAMRTPDAIHVATAQVTACDVFLTNDARLKTLSDLKVLLLRDAVA